MFEITPKGRIEHKNKERGLLCQDSESAAYLSPRARAPLENENDMTPTRAPKPVFGDRDLSSTFIKGMAVLRAFDDTHTRLTLAEIAQITHLDRASVRRLTLTLVHLGYAYKNGRHFSLSPKVLTLAGSFLRGNEFGTLVQPVLNRYSIRLGATVSLAILDDEEAVYVAESTTQDSEVSFGFTLGSRLPLLHTAIGRMILAFSDPDWTSERLHKTPLEQYTPSTTLDRDELARRVAACRQCGYAVVDGEFEGGVTGFAVPVGRVDNLKAVIGSVRPSLMVAGEEERQRIISLLQQVALELSRLRIFAND